MKHALRLKIFYSVLLVFFVLATYHLAHADSNVHNFQRWPSDFEVSNPLTANIRFNPSPCTGSYYGFYWFSDGPTPHAFADVPISDIGQDFVRNWVADSPFVELAGVIISDQPFGMTKLSLNPHDQFGVAWPPGVTICAPDNMPLVNSSTNPAERFLILSAENVTEESAVETSPEESLLANVLDAFLSLFGAESAPTAESIPMESATEASITAPLDATSTSTVTVTIDGKVPQAATNADETSITAPLDDADTSITTTTF